jgi:anti-sigma B factor antagonist
MSRAICSMAVASDPSLVVEIEPSDAVGEITVLASGEVDLCTAGELADTLAESLRRRPAALCVDLTGVQFLGAACLTALVRAQSEARSQRVRWRVLIPELPFVQRVFEVTGLSETLAVEVRAGAGR